LQNFPYTTHIPHSSRFIPRGVREQLCLSDEELAAELLKKTDHFTDELFRFESPLVETLVFPVSRLVVDPERFLEDEKEPMATHGMGAVYTRTSDGKALRESLTRAEREVLIERYYRPHHEKLERAVAMTLAAWNSCLIIDCHSFPSAPLPYEEDRSPRCQDICLGTDPVHTPRWLSEMAEAVFRAGGFSVDLNRPFGGSLVPATYYQKDHSVWSIMIEVNRSLYMDEASGVGLPRLAEISGRIQGIARALIKAGRKRIKTAF
jgi:N-formylglutamate deformylase